LNFHGSEDITGDSEKKIIEGGGGSIKLPTASRQKQVGGIDENKTCHEVKTEGRKMLERRF
jgi:hypothetical protein